jgi:hypothetical protein
VAYTSAYAPQGGPASAVTAASVGSGSEGLISLAPGEAASEAILTVGAPTFAVGAMGAEYGGTAPESLQYDAYAYFNFTTSTTGTLYLNLISWEGTGFDHLLLQATEVDGTTSTLLDTSDPGTAEAFFTANLVNLGSLAVGAQNIDLSYYLTMSDAQSFGFDYNLSGTPLTPAPAIAEPSTWAMMALGLGGLALAASPTVPEPSSWTMMALGFAAFAFAGYRGRKSVAVAT